MLLDAASRSSAFREWDRMPIGVTRAQLVRDRKGPNCKKIDPSRPAPTIAKNEGILGLRGFMHWHERRRFTVREFARMQSFPDAFDFGATADSRAYTKAVGQIGNSVPPMLMRSIALALLPQLGLEPVGAHDPLITPSAAEGGDVTRANHQPRDHQRVAVAEVPS
jgi:DNA (cytosine-5)-methyltransferase 1